MILMGKLGYSSSRWKQTRQMGKHQTISALQCSMQQKIIKLSKRKWGETAYSQSAKYYPSACWSPIIQAFSLCLIWQSNQVQFSRQMGFKSQQVPVCLDLFSDAERQSNIPLVFTAYCTVVGLGVVLKMTIPVPIQEPSDTDTSDTDTNGVIYLNHLFF